MLCEVADYASSGRSHVRQPGQISIFGACLLRITGASYFYRHVGGGRRFGHDHVE
jgi:hypothetical protein